MEIIGLSFIDWIIIFVYFAFVLGIGWYLRKFTKNEEDFFLARRKNLSWVAGLAFLSATSSALSDLGSRKHSSRTSKELKQFRKYYKKEES